MGRTVRQRNARKRASCCLATDGFQSFSSLTKWLKSVHNWKPSCKLRPHHFDATGRGIQCLHPLKPGDPVCAMPISCLITPDVVDSDPVVGSSCSNRSMCVKLVSFLMRHWLLGDESPWKAYLDSVPVTYNNPGFICCSKDILSPGSSSLILKAVPEPFRSPLDKFLTRVTCDRSTVEEIFRTCRLPFDPSTFNRAWFGVNTRCFSFLGAWALAPFLDLFNHSPFVETEVNVIEPTLEQGHEAHDKSRKLFVLTTNTRCKKRDQVFIKYDAHTNTDLWMEYGFVCPGNPHEFVEFLEEEVVQAISRVLRMDGDSCFPSRPSGPLSFIRGEGFSCAVIEMIENSMKAVSHISVDERARLESCVFETLVRAKIFSLSRQVESVKVDGQLPAEFVGPLIGIIEDWIDILLEFPLGDD